MLFQKSMFILFLLFLSTYTFSQDKDKIVEHYSKIYFGGGFGKKGESADSINLTVNNYKVYENQKLYSLNYGASPGTISIIRVKKELSLIYLDVNEDDVIYLGKKSKNDKISVEIDFREKQYLYEIDLKEGKFIIFYNDYYDGFKFDQSHKPFGFE